MKGDRIHEVDFTGIRDGYRGLVEDDTFALSRKAVRGLSKQGGTILGTSRVNAVAEGPERIKQVMEKRGIDSLIAIGGEGSLNGARELYEAGIPVVGVPKTIDNDLSGTDYTFGFDTAVHIATECIDRLRTTTESHHRCMVVEVMGRHAGWIALHAGIAAGAHAILIPEVKVGLEQICEWVEATRDRGRAPVIVVSEGFIPEGVSDEVAVRGFDSVGRPRLGGVSDMLAPIIEERTGIETRATILGHLQRGGTPTSYDRVLATRFGTNAIDAVMDKKWGHMVALHGIDIVTVPLDDATNKLKTVPRKQWDEAAILFG